MAQHKWVGKTRGIIFNMGHLSKGKSWFEFDDWGEIETLESIYKNIAWFIAHNMTTIS